jgi:hypothetical protein
MEKMGSSPQICCYRPMENNGKFFLNLWIVYNSFFENSQRNPLALQRNARNDNKEQWVVKKNIRLINLSNV